MKFARNVRFQIKNGKEKEFTTMFENDGIPTLRKQKGFQDELTLVIGNRGMGISLWDNRDSAESYQASAFPRIVEKLVPVIEGTPHVENYDVAMTTLRA
ncbi:MAG: hypothetical protein ABI592_16605 [Acidobacteriota bacterium]